MPKKAASSSGKSRSKKDAKGSLAPLLGSKHKPPTAWQAFSKAARKKLLGWLHPVVKYNGKTLQPYNAVLARFMVRTRDATAQCRYQASQHQATCAAANDLATLFLRVS
jgi:hypothetical protein